MNELTCLLSAIGRGESGAAEKLLPLVYDELRRLAAQKLAHERPGHTLQPTALVHEAWLRLAGQDPDPAWDGRGHFFAAAAEAMRRILIESAERKSSRKRGGGMTRRSLDDAEPATPEPGEDILALDEALKKLAKSDPTAAELVQLRYFGGLTLAESADVLGIARRTADRLWAWARAWLHREISGSGPHEEIS